MTRSVSGRPVVAGVVALYALVAGLLLPFHLLEHDEAAAERGPAGVVLSAWCTDRGCEEPTHHHRPVHAHDPATCVSCAQAKAACTPAPSAPVAAPAEAPSEATPVEVPDAPVPADRSLPSARGPPPRLS